MTCNRIRKQTQWERNLIPERPRITLLVNLIVSFSLSLSLLFFCCIIFIADVNIVTFYTRNDWYHHKWQMCVVIIWMENKKIPELAASRQRVLAIKSLFIDNIVLSARRAILEAIWWKKKQGITHGNNNKKALSSHNFSFISIYLYQWQTEKPIWKNSKNYIDEVCERINFAPMIKAYHAMCWTKWEPYID